MLRVFLQKECIHTNARTRKIYEVACAIAAIDALVSRQGLSLEQAQRRGNLTQNSVTDVVAATVRMSLTN